MAETFKPESAQQRKFLSTPADIAVYGGSAGGGKTFALLLEPLRYVQRKLDVPFAAAIFRKQSTQVTNPGGLWDQSMRIYPLLGARPHLTALRWTFPSGSTIRFAHLDMETDTLAWQGTELAFIGFDEMTHFSEGQFFYMLSRNRSMSGVRPYVRATCNPDPDSFVAKLIEWWIDQDTGLAIPERDGVIRWFIRVSDELIWADSRAELVAKFGEESFPKSITFIRGSIYDNKVFLAKDPGYLANLKALPTVERERLLGGNWKIRPAAGLMFKREWFGVVEVPPADVAFRIRYWDRAGTDPEAGKDPDWTAGVMVSRERGTGLFYVEDVIRFRGQPHEVEKRILNVASQDGRNVMIGLEQDPGQAGKADVSHLIRALAGYNVKAYPATRDKVTRANPASAQAGAGNIKIVRGKWNDTFLSELENFPTGSHDDQVDGLSGGVNALSEARKIILV
jgi:predicted phage terminase large subunit-like protein